MGNRQGLELVKDMIRRCFENIFFLDTVYIIGGSSHFIKKKKKHFLNPVQYARSMVRAKSFAL